MLSDPVVTKLRPDVCCTDDFTLPTFPLASSGVPPTETVPFGVTSDESP